MSATNPKYVGSYNSDGLLNIVYQVHEVIGDVYVLESIFYLDLIYFIGLFSSPQYILEIQPEDHEKPSRYEWLDEGRMAVAENPSREVDPETVKGEKPGSGFLPDFLPEFDFS